MLCEYQTEDNSLFIFFITSATFFAVKNNKQENHKVENALITFHRSVNLKN